jgi:xanthine/CO dehydrogenase XdhC/CoxF family maturation factor
MFTTGDLKIACGGLEPAAPWGDIMKEIREISREWERHRGQQLALATLVRAQGSSYRRPGARMLVCPDGLTVGSLSGGCLEEEVAARAFAVMATGTPSLMSFDTRLRFGCHGSIEVFVEAVRESFLAELAAHFMERRRCRVLTVFEGEEEELGTRLLKLEEQIPGGAFLQEIEPPIQLVIFGDGPDSVPLRVFAEILGWDVIEVDQATDFPGGLDERTAAIVKSHNYGRDFAALHHLLQLDLPYVGLLGPRKRRDQLLNAVLDSGVSIDSDIFAPAGLDLGAETPEEIALALVSEIQAVFGRASADSLRDRKTPIHGWNIVRKPIPAPAEACPASAP